ncbi:MAG: arginine--tRNA ligase [Actinomycetota bacterium]
MAEANPIAELRGAVREVAQQLSGKGAGAEATLERPPQAEHGDYSSNAAMLLAGPLGKPPREVAEELRSPLADRLGASAEQIEVAGPGFVNLFLSERWYRQAIAGLVAAGEDAGIRPAEETERVLIEFVSANPTGPLTAAGGRHAAYGDAMARLLEATGHGVGREYYSNDIGGQMDRFGQSIAAAIAGSEPPEDGYEGAYVAELGERLAAEGIDPSDPDALAQRGAELMLESIRETLLRYGVEFDTWSSQRSFEESGAVEAVIDELREAGRTFESEGAVWLGTTEFGDDKDRVLLRSDGEPTYFASDIAYHRDKLGRGFEHLIDVLGADHHGYVERMWAALQALGFDGDVFEAQIMQFVHIVERGERAQMSKRRGDFVTLDELLDDIGVDATRFFMLQRSHDSTVDLDLELAREQSNDNPVYYVQYAHARIASILRKAGEEGIDVEAALATDLSAVEAPVEPAERALVKRLLELPDEVLEAADRRAPHRLCAYAGAVAADFHVFYRDCLVVGAEGEGVQESRLAICVATKRAITRTLGLLGISAPERM